MNIRSSTEGFIPFIAFGFQADDSITHAQGWIDKADVTFSWTAPPADRGLLTVRYRPINLLKLPWTLSLG